MIGDAVDKHRVAHQTAGQLEPRFSLLTKLLIHPSLSIFARTERHSPPSLLHSLFYYFRTRDSLFDHDGVER